MGELLLDLTIKGTLALLAAAGVVALLRGRSAATRHAVWTMGMASALAVPALSRLLPGWSVALIPASAPGDPSVAPSSAAAVDWGFWIACVWAVGVAVVLASVVLGRFRVWWIARRATAIDHGEIPALATALCGEMSISRRVSVRLSPARVMPMVWGVTRPVVLLPAEAAAWSSELRRDVLLHELAHVRRHDYLNQLVARFACAVHWFNPLVWIAARRLRAEREQACDDHVLGTGASACDYADHLVAVARDMLPAARGTLGVTMASRSAFGERVAALLDARRTRGILTPGLLLRSGVGAACLVVPLAALHPGARTAASPNEPPPVQLIGPPPSANARAAGALPEVEPTPRVPDEDGVQRSRSPRREGAVRPAPRKVAELAPRTSILRDGVPVIQAAVIRAVVETEESDAVRSAVGDGESSGCTESKAPAAMPAAHDQDPTLVWIPAAGATP